MEIIDYIGILVALICVAWIIYKIKNKDSSCGCGSYECKKDK